MKGMQVVLLGIVFSMAPSVWAESLLQQAGKSMGELVGEAGGSVASGIKKSMQSNEPQWITIEPKSKETCLKESGGTLDHTYMRCRNGRQEYVRFDTNGQKVVLSERAIPAYR